MNRKTLVLLTASFLALSVAAARGGQESWPRITTRDGTFVNTRAGRVFRPMGFNYIRLYPGPGWHTMFAPDLYEPERAEKMLAELGQRDFNVVRVFIDHRSGSGIVKSRDATELSNRYMENFVNFTRRARAHGIYVVPTFPYVPRSKPYRDLIGGDHPHVKGHNRYYLQEGYIRAKCRYLADFARAIKRQDPSLLTSILAFELENETHFNAQEPPFSLDEGTLEAPNGERYELGDAAELQRMADQNVVHWANRCAESIRRVDPDALVAASMFTFRAVGRTRPGKLGDETSHDARFPARPAALARSNLSYLDIHSYPQKQETLRHDLWSIEFQKTRNICESTGKPIIMGEFGAFRKWFDTPQAAALNMSTYVHRILDRSFDGFIYWTYDTDEQERLWNARSDQSQILRALTRAANQNRPEK